MTVNIQVLLKSRPAGKPSIDNFEIEEIKIPDIQNGQILTRTIYLSLDPYMRGRMSDAKSYAEPVPLGGVMIGGAVGIVEKSKLIGYDVAEEILDQAGTNFIIKESKLAHTIYKRGN